MLRLTIMSLADQLCRSRSTTPEGPQRGKIYFSENPVPDLISGGIKILRHNIGVFNESLEKNEIFTTFTDSTKAESNADHIHDMDAGSNAVVNEIFITAQEASNLTSDLADIVI